MTAETRYTDHTRKASMTTNAQAQQKSREAREALGGKRISAMLDAPAVKALGKVRKMLARQGLKATDVGAIQYALRMASEK